MSVDIKLSGDTADAICRDSLKFHMKMIKQDIKDRSRQDTITPNEAATIEGHRRMMIHMKAVREYYGKD
jgi:hypothetical protein